MPRVHASTSVWCDCRQLCSTATACDLVGRSACHISFENLQPEKKYSSEDAPSKYPQGTPMPDEGKHKKVDYQGPEYKLTPDYNSPDYKTPGGPVPEYKAPGYKAPEYKVGRFEVAAGSRTPKSFSAKAENRQINIADALSGCRPPRTCCFSLFLIAGQGL